jgi:hypothetical protein
MIWFFRIAGRILSEVDKAIIVAEMGLAEGDLRSCAARLSVSFGKALRIGVVKPPSDQRTGPSSWIVDNYRPTLRITF